MESIKQSNGSSYYFDDVEVDCGNFCVQKQGKVKSLTPRAFDVLLYLIEQRGHVVEKQELFDRIWKESFVTDYALARAIKEIRQALGDDAGAPRYVETIPKRGYRFIAELSAGNGTSAEEVNEEMPGGVALTESKPAAREAETTSAPSLIGGVKSRTRALLLTFIALLMAGGTIYYFAISRQPAI